MKLRKVLVVALAGAGLLLFTASADAQMRHGGGGWHGWHGGHNHGHFHDGHTQVVVGFGFPGWGWGYPYWGAPYYGYYYPPPYGYYAPPPYYGSGQEHVYDGHVVTNDTSK